MDRKQLLLIPILLIGIIVGNAQTTSEFEGKVKITHLDADNTSDSLVVKLPDGTLGLRDAGTITSLQVLSISNDTIFLSNGGFVKLPPRFDRAFSSLVAIPSGLLDGDDDTQLTESEVDMFTSNNGYLTSEIDGSITNELQALSISNDTVFLADGGFVKLPTGFDGAFGSLTGVPADLSDGDDDTQLTEAQVDAFANNNGYLTTEIDGSATNELQVLSISNDTVFLENGGFAKLPASFDGAFGSLTGVPIGLSNGDDDTQLTETQVDDFANNNGYLTSEIDGSISNELQTLSTSNDTIFLTDGGFAKVESNAGSVAFRAEQTIDYNWSITPDDTIVVNNSWVDNGLGDYQTTYDIGSNFNSTTGVFTAPLSGLYYLEFNAIFRSESFHDNLFHSFISINGSVSSNCIKSLSVLHNAGNTYLPEYPAFKSILVSGVIKLMVGDLVDVKMAYLDEPASYTPFLAKHTSFSGYLISKL